MPKISVIVPVYNVEKYLKQCLESIINQTFKDIEIICVNDGSLDKSRKILEEYKNKDSRIRIIDKKNGGLSSARNAGLRFSTGEYISFIDSDDWIDETMFEKLYNNITKMNTDISICAVHRFDEKKSQIDDSNPYFTLEYFNETFDNKVFSYKDTTHFLMDVCVMAWNKLYRKSFLDELGVEFPEGLIFEDGPFFFSIFFKTNRVSIIRDFLYYYRINRKGSIVQKGGKHFIDIIDVVDLMYNSIKDTPVFDEIKSEFLKRKINDIVYRYGLVNIFYKWKFYRKIKNKKYLFDDDVFKEESTTKELQLIYLKLIEMRDKNNIIRFYKNKYKIKFMYKIMQILYTEENIYYLKYRKLILRIKKHPKICDIWYQDDRIYVVLFYRIKFNFKFEYSKLEQS